MRNNVRPGNQCKHKKLITDRLKAVVLWLYTGACFDGNVADIFTLCLYILIRFR